MNADGYLRRLSNIELADKCQAYRAAAEAEAAHEHTISALIMWDLHFQAREEQARRDQPAWHQDHLGEWHQS